MKKANSLVDSLPHGPQWSSVEVQLDGIQTEEPIILYMRDAEEITEYLFGNPLFAGHMNLVPVKHFDKDGKRIWNEPISGSQAWDTQVR